MVINLQIGKKEGHQRRKNIEANISKNYRFIYFNFYGTLVNCKGYDKRGTKETCSKQRPNIVRYACGGVRCNYGCDDIPSPIC